MEVQVIYTEGGLSPRVNPVIVCLGKRAMLKLPRAPKLAQGRIVFSLYLGTESEQISSLVDGGELALCWYPLSL